jgi:hypothetical protein
LRLFLYAHRRTAPGETDRNKLNERLETI